MKHIKLFENWSPEEYQPISSDDLGRLMNQPGKPILIVADAGVDVAGDILLAAEDLGEKVIDISRLDIMDLAGLTKVSGRTVSTISDEERAENVRRMRSGESPIVKPAKVETIAHSERPSWMPKGGSGIILADSIDTAPMSVLNVILNLGVGIGEHKLPEGWKLVATASNMSKMPQAIADRFRIFSYYTEA